MFGKQTFRTQDSVAGTGRNSNVCWQGLCVQTYRRGCPCSGMSHEHSNLVHRSKLRNGRDPWVPGWRPRAFTGLQVGRGHLSPLIW